MRCANGDTEELGRVGLPWRLGWSCVNVPLSMVIGNPSHSWGALAIHSALDDQVSQAVRSHHALRRIAHLTGTRRREEDGAPTHLALKYIDRRNQHTCVYGYTSIKRSTVLPK